MLFSLIALELLRIAKANKIIKVLFILINDNFWTIKIRSTIYQVYVGDLVGQEMLPYTNNGLLGDFTAHVTMESKHYYECDVSTY